MDGLTKLKAALEGFQSKMSPGPDGLKPIIFKHLPPNVEEHLLAIYYKCCIVLLKYTPKLLKETKVVFIPKHHFSATRVGFKLLFFPQFIGTHTIQNCLCLRRMKTDLDHGKNRPGTRTYVRLCMYIYGKTEYGECSRRETLQDQNNITIAKVRKR